MERDFDDVKLAGERPSEQIRAARAADDKWEIHRQNGNIVRAQKIGATLGGFAAGVKTKKDDETRESSREESLRPALTAFACVAAIESELPDKLL
ncbi:MAG: hypothetical protein FWE86_03710, partial [Oscillospiraceae bacterium]|nr:hypothetical protein [Oscillospiraceae bacterium]